MPQEMSRIVEFRGYKCRVIKAAYDNGRRAILLKEAGTGEPVATATVNLPDEEIGTNQAFIKDYSENVGMLQVLIEAGIVRDTGIKAASGYCTFPLVDIL